jgi:hypothetical protein
MYMFFFAIHLYQSGFEFLADAGEQIMQRTQGGAVEDPAAVFCH